MSNDAKMRSLVGHRMGALNRGHKDVTHSTRIDKKMMKKAEYQQVLAPRKYLEEKQETRAC